MLASLQPLHMPARGLRAGTARSQRLARARPAAPTAFFNRGGNGGASSGRPNTGSAAGGGDAQETLVSDGAIKSLSPEARRIFREAQDNIIELNKSRLRALEELKAARQKIAELEEKLEAAVQEASQATAALQQLGPSSSQAAAAAGAPLAAAAASGMPMSEVVTFSFDPAQQQQQQQQPQQQQWQQPPQQQQPPAQYAPPESDPTITVVYETGWSQAFLHCNVDDRGWTPTPGQRMDNGSQQFPDKKVLTVPGRRMEFVINDGGSDWDKPSHSAKGNYVVDSPGTYRIKNGKVTKLA